MTQPQVPSIDPELVGVRNFRDVGGLPAAEGRRVRPGMLFRSGHLAHATEADTAFLSSLGLHTVFDFRNAADIRLDGADVALPGVRTVNIPLSDPADGSEFWELVQSGDLEQLRAVVGDGKAEQRMIGSYREIVLSRTAEHGRLLGALTDGALPVLMHCAAGKDRAGLSIAVTLLALGVDRGAIEADYLESAAAHRKYRLRSSDDSAATPSPEVTALLAPLFDARAEYLAAAFETIDATWGGTDDYLRHGLGVTTERLAALRARLLTD